jgi:hypothetical protein
MPSSSRLKPYRFVSQSPQGLRDERIFYAESLKQATVFAIKWGKKTSHKMYRVKAKRGI